MIITVKGNESYNTDKYSAIKIISKKDYQLNEYPVIVGINGEHEESIVFVPYKNYPWDNDKYCERKTKELYDKIINAWKSGEASVEIDF